ncbi:MAG: hypothetical protein HOC60_04980 [Rhodospirillaceae bacterium]|nr:hypothetical protein [Rhodospirillaceae bacterium]
MRIPLPRLLRQWRRRWFETGGEDTKTRLGLAAWAFLAKRPALYRPLMAIGTSVLKLCGGGGRRFPILPRPEGGSFVDQWKRGKR